MRLVAAIIGFVLATAAGTFAALPVYAMGLVVPMVVVWPLTLATVALVAALVASLFGNLTVRGGTRARLLVVVGVSEGTAVVLALASASTYLAPDSLPAWPAIYYVVVASAASALAATAAAHRWRSASGSWRRDVLAAVALLLLTPLLVYGAIVAACTTGLGCGA